MRVLSVIFLVIGIGCKSTSNNSQSQSNTVDDGIFQEVDRALTDSSIKITLKNTSEMGQTILSPMEKSIEQNVDGEWVKVGVLYCDCGGPPCPAPPNEREVEPGGVFTFTWDLMSEECVVDDRGQRSTIKSKSSSGSYRAIYTYRSQGGKPQRLELNFWL